MLRCDSAHTHPCTFRSSERCATCTGCGVWPGIALTGSAAQHFSSCVARSVLETFTSWPATGAMAPNFTGHTTVEFVQSSLAVKAGCRHAANGAAAAAQQPQSQAWAAAASPRASVCDVTPVPLWGSWAKQHDMRSKWVVPASKAKGGVF